MNVGLNMKIIIILSLFSHFISAKSVSVMTYNAENLFDTKHDIGKQDYTYLPLRTKMANPQFRQACENMSNDYYRRSCLTLDWNENLLNHKIRNLSRVIKEVSPDILVLQEVENINVLRQLRDRGLPTEGYREIVLIEGPDSRGIDVGILSKYPLSERPKLHLVNLPLLSGDQTRGVLEATFRIGRKNLTIFGNHWPSQRNPDSHRVAAARVLNRQAGLARNPVIATGDFNVMPDDLTNAIEHWITNVRLPNSFYDAEIQATGRHSGTHNYRGRWSSLDRIFILRNPRQSGLSPQFNSFQIIKKPWMLRRNSRGEVIPFRFDSQTGQGYSDHLPVTMSFDID